MSTAKIVTAVAVLVLAIAGAAVWLALPPPSGSGPAGVSGSVSSTGEATVGGPFTLTDHTGKRVSEADYRGRYMLLFFGFTSCPDICPTELQVMSVALDRLGDTAQRIQPIFVTIDPERDTAERLADYVSNFHPSLVGLTGSAEEIAAVAKAYRVYYRKVGDEAGDDYTMDHSSILYLMDPEGRFVAHFAYGTDPDKLAERIRQAVGADS